MNVEACPPAADPMAGEADVAGRPDARLGGAGRIAGSGWWVAVAAVVFLSLSLAQIVQSPGMHYDEAILVQGAVRMLTSPDKPTFAHDAGSWIPLGKRWWPLMAILGLICLGVAHYMRRTTPRAALLAGIATGPALWARLNFLWFLVAVAAGVLLVAGRRAVPPLGHLTAFSAGGILGGAPLLVYEGLSHFATLRLIQVSSNSGPLVSMLQQRWYELSELLVSDGQQRWMWGGPPVPGWERYAITLVLGTLLLVCLAPPPNEQTNGDRWGRAAGVALLLCFAIPFTSRLPIRQHHLVTVLPLVGFVCVFGFRRLLRRGRLLQPIVVAVGGGYLVLALWWNVAAIRGLHQTGGVGPWSDAIVGVTQYLETSHPNDDVEVLDWGLPNNVSFLSDGRVHPREVFWGATSAGIASGHSWPSIVAAGGVFLAFDEHSANLEFFPAATAGFRAALAASGAQSSPAFGFPNGMAPGLQR